jgi:integrase
MPAHHDDLEPIDPRTAQDLFLDHKATSCTEATVRNHRYRTNHFVRWCTESDRDNLNALTGRDIQQYRLWRQEDGDLNNLTLSAQMSTLRVFLKWARTIEAVPEDLYTKVQVPRIRPEERNRDETLDADTAQDLLAYLSRFQYGLIEHVVIALLWETGMRIGSVRSLDVANLDFANNHLELVHRPNEGTTLKNGVAGERLVAMQTDLSQLVEDYIEHTRCERTDEYGREPLLTTSQGRTHRNTIRRMVYRVTAPCFRGDACPDCTEETDAKCPEAVSPHAIRRGSITHLLSNDVPVEIVSDRMNVSRKVLDEHYDKRLEEVKLEQRRSFLENV